MSFNVKILIPSSLKVQKKKKKKKKIQENKVVAQYS